MAEAIIQPAADDIELVVVGPGDEVGVGEMCPKLA
jgi:hypothetical protein